MSRADPKALKRLRDLLRLAASASEHEARNAAVEACRLIADGKLEVYHPDDVQALRREAAEARRLRAALEEIRSAHAGWVATEQVRSLVDRALSSEVGREVVRSVKRSAPRVAGRLAEEAIESLIGGRRRR